MLRTTIRTFSRLQSTSARATTAPAAAQVFRKSNDAVQATSTAQSNTNKPHSKKATPVDPEEYKRRLEERFGGAEASALGTLVDGKPEGLASNVKRNMFRLI
ncbi:hypothetical protein JCM8547_005017 [Rhodosporidiobolus lusitaniae]